MPTYAYRCRECEDQFELARPMSESSSPAQCPAGHADTVKLLTTFALAGRAPTPATTSGGGGGGCCGGACGCG